MSKVVTNFKINLRDYDYTISVEILDNSRMKHFSKQIEMIGDEGCEQTMSFSWVIKTKKDFDTVFEECRLLLSGNDRMAIIDKNGFVRDFNPIEQRRASATYQ